MNNYCVLLLLNWFEEYYIGWVIRNRRIFVRFSTEILNVPERVVNKNDRTNDYVETANRRHNFQIRAKRPISWALISCLKKV